MKPALEAEVTVILVTYNSAHCLPEQTKRLASLLHICIVDNGSSDDIEAQAHIHLPQAQVIRLPKNLGFGAANNIALRQAKTKFALLLNPDCLIEIADIHRLLETAELYPASAIIAPQVWRSASSKELSYRFPGGYWGAKSQEAAQAPCSVGFVTGAAMLFRLSVFEGIGYFDESFFLYYEDEDLCLRCFEARRPPVIEPAAKALHISRSSVKEGFPYRSQYIRGYHHAQSKIHFTAKHVSPSAASKLRQKTLALAIVAMPFRLLWPDLRYVMRQWGRIRGLLAYHE